MELFGIYMYLWKGEPQMLKVLIVEDDPMVRDINERFLRKVEGYTLYKSVNSIEKAKEIILNKKLDLILLDVFFPQGRGLELLKWIRRENLKCDVILITADKSVETVEEAFRYGAVDYIIKPFKFKRFEEAMNQYKTRKSNFRNIGNAEQEMIDEFTLNSKVTTQKENNMSEHKGFSQHTYKRIVKAIKENNLKNFTAQEIAKEIGVSRITARRYLDYLEREQKVILELEYGKVGRPKNKYRLVEEEE
jgi:response regulator of citrate/malate metabolism